MCRLLGYCSRRDVSLEDLIGSGGLRDFTGLCALHGDGWGMAWYEAAELVICKSPIRAGAEAKYDKLAREPLSDMGLVHLRWATPGLGGSGRDSHPFRYGHHVLAHNGAIRPQGQLPDMLPAAWESRVGGTTDSERYFLLIMSRLADHDGDMVAAIADAGAEIEARFEPNSLNAILLSPEKLYAISWFHPERIPQATLRARGYAPGEVESYFDLSYRASQHAIVVASSGWPQPGWTPIPNRQVLVTDRNTLRTDIVPLAPPRCQRLKSCT